MHMYIWLGPWMVNAVIWYTRLTDLSIVMHISVSDLDLHRFMKWLVACSAPSSYLIPLQWRHIGRDSVSNRQPHDCLLNRLFRRKSKKTSKLRVTGLCAGNSPVTGEFPAQMASNAENVSIWWRHYAMPSCAFGSTFHWHLNPNTIIFTHKFFFWNCCSGLRVLNQR